MRILFALVLACGMAIGQSFEVASVKPADPKSTPGARGGPGTSDPGHVTYTNFALSSILMRAFDLSSWDQVLGPATLRTSKYDIAATVPAGATTDQFRLMLVNLLSERFHMVLHRETREFPAYDLVIAKGGPKLKASSASDSALAEQGPGTPLTRQDPDGQWHLDNPGMAMRPVFGARVQTSVLMVRAQTLGEVMRFLQGFMQTSIVDKTGLTGRYDFTLTYTLDSSVSGAPEMLDNTPPYILDLVQSQLGLKLQPAKIALDTVVVDSFDPVPTEN